MKFAHFSHVWGKPNMTAHERYEQLWRELELCDELGFDFRLQILWKSDLAIGHKLR